MSIYLPAEKRFILVNRLAILSLLLVIVAGGVVRSTGSGMGCPDWPKCFNQYIPPTDKSQLPEGYEQTYIDSRAKKNERFSKLLEAIGFKDLADRIRNDKSILIHEEFNAAKTWTEYVNRLIGVITGVFLLLCVVFSWIYVKTHTRIFVCSVINLFVVFLQAWLGAIVVSTNLMPWVITVHMLLALLILCISIYTYFHARVHRESKLLLNLDSNYVRWICMLALSLSVVQIVIGTDVREQIDMIAINEQNRSIWTTMLDHMFNWHRYLAVAVVLVNMAFFFIVRSRYAHASEQSRWVNFAMALVLLQLLSGFVLVYFGFPAYMQTVHLVIACVLFAVQFYLLLLTGKTRQYIGQ
ncbi:COX15/CtaA family protein [Olivibacter sitiensis]|uniref:COX15/CtaA family protein n=1 Tax=Olivibacter sitiensis TaxID=376470 RepID=UPI0003F9A982|nr:COX15/CtaA family protein [Olivibacter sitiensis]